ncbi:hypothetical protein S40285_09940 [Stachybotrys chlorohalonatus IBT 40285]|uniref:Uncharacterized protein n=1 Tax=Stachybotrys chlorohalonatus (strain IBT 40285) TaxID=1283841 RepID=A0A084QHG4_STAC4|nr:hypothetical protein S40285_09940 [Stachybotrys chlorohalonata IBT 40285]
MPSNEYIFQEEDYDVFGEDGMLIGIELCVSGNVRHPETLKSGRSLFKGATSNALGKGLTFERPFVCQNGSGDNSCRAPSAVLPNIAVTASLYARQAIIVAARSNYSIISVLEKTDPSLIRMDEEDILAYHDAFRSLLNYIAAGVRARSSIAKTF